VSIAVGDFDGDGKLDVVVTDGITNVSVLQGKGDGTFLPAQDYGGGGYCVAVGDVNGDGKLDVVMGTPNYPSSVGVLLGNGDGTFQAARNYPAKGPSATAVRSVAAGDFNGDGKLDLAVANSGYFVGYVSVLLGKGDGTFLPAVNYTTGDGSFFVAIGDFNRDGKLDLAVANNSDNDVSVLLGNGDGTFQAQVNYSVHCCPGAVAVANLSHGT